MTQYKFQIEKEWFEYPFTGGIEKCEKTVEVIAPNADEAFEKSGFGPLEDYTTDFFDLRRMSARFSKPDTRERVEGMLEGIEGEAWVTITLMGVA